MTQYDVPEVSRRFRRCRFILPSKFQKNKPQDVSRGLLVASGGHLLRSEGARRAVGGSSGAKMELQGSQKRSFEISRCHRKPANAPKEPPRAPKTSPREPQNTMKSIFRSQTMIFHKSSCRRDELKVFEGRKVSLRAQNRHQEARREGKIMTSKKGAIEDTKKSHKYSQTRSRKKSF